MEDNYERIYFVNRTLGIKGKSKIGAKVGKYLVVGRSHEQLEQYKLYVITTGLPLVDFYFTEFEEVCKFGEWINSIYSDYLPILEQYPEIDLFSLVKWSVKDGIQMYEMLNMLERVNEANLGIIASAHAKAEEKIEEWTRKFNVG